MTAIKAITGTIAVLAILIGLWFGGWWLAGLNQSKQYEVNTHSQQWQSGLIAQERDRITAYDASDNDAQKAQIKSTFCAAYLDLQPPPADLAQANARIC